MEVSAALLLFYREKLNVSVSPSGRVPPPFPPPWAAPLGSPTMSLCRLCLAF